MKRFFLFIITIVILEILFRFYAQVVEPDIKTAMALEAVNGSFVEVRTYQVSRDTFRSALFLVEIGLTILIFYPVFLPNKKNNNTNK